MSMLRSVLRDIFRPAAKRGTSLPSSADASRAPGVIKPKPSVDLLCATRHSKQQFWETSALGRSLMRLAHEHRLSSRIVFENTRGLSEIYNEHISTGDANDIVLFIHDDAWIDDFFLVDRVMDGLKIFDVIGIAGNRKRVPRQPSWAFVDMRLVLDDSGNLSGAVAHGDQAFAPVDSFGPAPAECEILDGLLLAAKRSTLNARGVRFDPRFQFHFYDMDFCRTARERGLRLGTWPICLTHQSTGAFGSPGWMSGYDKYLAKWGE